MPPGRSAPPVGSFVCGGGTSKSIPWSVAQVWKSDGRWLGRLIKDRSLSSRILQTCSLYCLLTRALKSTMMLKELDLCAIVKTQIRPLNSSAIVIAYRCRLIAVGRSNRSSVIRHNGCLDLCSDSRREMTCVAFDTPQASHLTVGTPRILTPRAFWTSFSSASGPRCPARRCHRLAESVHGGRGSRDLLRRRRRRIGLMAENTHDPASEEGRE